MKELRFESRQHLRLQPVFLSLQQMHLSRQHEGDSEEDVYLLCPRLRIRETTKEPTPMQAQEGLLASLSLGPSIPITAEQGLGPQSGLQLGFLWAGLGNFKGWKNFSSSVYVLIWVFQGHWALFWLGSVVFLIWDSLPRTFCSFSCKVQLLFTGA